MGLEIPIIKVNKVKNYGLILLSFLLFNNTFCQYKVMSVDSIYKYRVKKFLIKEDSTIKEYKYPIIEVNKLFIQIAVALFSKNTNEFHLKGKICFNDDTVYCSGIPSVLIFKAVNKNNILRNKIELGETSHVKDSVDKNGYFDITFRIEKNESLFFFMPYFYIEEFKLGEILKP